MYVCICEVPAYMYVISSIKRLTIPGGKSAVHYTDLSDKESHRQAGVDTMVTSGSLDGVMVSTLTQNVIHVSSIPAILGRFYCNSKY